MLYPVPFVDDVSKMYRNVKSGELNVILKRMLWRNCKVIRDPDIYCFNEVTFGYRPASCIVVSALRYTANMFSFVSDEVSEVFKRYPLYIDDICSGINSLAGATALVSDIETIVAKGFQDKHISIFLIC